VGAPIDIRGSASTPEFFGGRGLSVLLPEQVTEVLSVLSGTHCPSLALCGEQSPRLDKSSSGAVS